MKIHRFIISDFDLQSGRIEDKTLVHQMTRVLKLRRGEIFILCDGINHEVEAAVDDFDDRSMSYRVTQFRDYIEDTDIRCVLICSILKKENFEFVVQKAVELGVTEIVPMITSRTVKTGLRMDRLQAIAKEAAEQSGRGFVPVIREAISLEDSLADYVDCQRFIAHTSNAEIIVGGVGGQKSRAILIGPEGGFEDREIESAQRAGWRVISLGEFVLRAETAAIIATSVMRSIN